MKKNDLTIAIASIINDVTARIETKAQYMQSVQSTASDDEKEALRLEHKALVTKLRYVNKLTREKAQSVLASTIKDESMLNAVINNSYSLEKLSAMCEAIALKDKSYLESAVSLSDAVTYLASIDFKDVTADKLRANLFNKTRTQAHKTTTQARQFLLLLERLNVASTNKETKVTSFDKDAKLIENLNELFA